MRVRRMLGRSAVVVALLTAGGVPASAAPVRGEPGAPGLGDEYYPTYGNGGYDVAHYDLDLTYDPTSGGGTITRATATLTATALQDLSAFNLDLHGLTVDGVTVGGQAARSARDKDEFTVTPATPVAKGAAFTVVVKYHGTPQIYKQQLGSSGWFRTPNGAVVAGQPEVAASWFPANDHPRDKATYTTAITVPKGRVAISNGVPQPPEDNGGWTTFRYTEASPMASYLATSTIGDFVVDTTQHQGRPMIIATERTPAQGSQPIIDAVKRTGEAIDFLVPRYGPYPFGSAGGTVANVTGMRFALENQTRPTYPGIPFNGDQMHLVIHENAHQWSGDSVSLHDWKDMWLNEGFATYAEWMWSEHTGKATADALFRKNYDGAPHLWLLRPAHPGRANLFHPVVYVRGAMTLHALRRKVGDDAFFRIVREWTAQHRDGVATTAQFMEHAEKIAPGSGKLLNTWLYQKERPAYPTLAASPAELAAAGRVMADFHARLAAVPGH